MNVTICIYIYIYMYYTGEYTREYVLHIHTPIQERFLQRFAILSFQSSKYLKNYSWTIHKTVIWKLH